MNCLDQSVRLLITNKKHPMKKIALAIRVASLMVGCKDHLRTITLPEDMIMIPAVSSPYVPSDGDSRSIIPIKR